MNDFRAIALKLGGALLLAMSAAACTSGNERQGAQSTGNYDVDPRNNEDATLGAKSVGQQMNTLPPRDSIDKTEFHLNSRLSMNEAMSDRLVAAIPELSAAYVAVTESNVYAAVKLRSATQAEGGVQAQSKALNSMADGKGQAGIFGNGQGPLLDWRMQDGMTTELQGRITAALHRMIPNKANIFVSSNPYYVRRMGYYREQARSGSSMDHFVNEFNTMSHYAFPANANAANQNAVGGNR